MRALPSACQKGSDKLVGGEVSSPARCRGSNRRFEPSAVSPRAKPENPKGFQPPYHPHQFLLKSKRFPGAKTAGKRFLLWKMRFTKTAPRPPRMSPSTIESSRGSRPSRALRGFFDSLRRAGRPFFFAVRGVSEKVPETPARGFRAIGAPENPLEQLSLAFFRGRFRQNSKKRGEIIKSDACFLQTESI